MLPPFEAAANSPVAVKTNILYDALLNANLGVEARLDSSWTIDLSGNYNGWRLSHGRQWKHWFVQPELRYWTKESMRGHFFAGHLFGGQFNTTLNKLRRQGWGLGIGIGYGYAWRIARHWGIEAEIAVGYARYKYDKFPCAQCGRKIGERNRNYIGPTKAALNIVYYFGGDKPKEIVEPAPPVFVPEPVIEAPVVEVRDTLPKFNFLLVDVPHSHIRSENISGVARIQFAVNKTDINEAIGANASELGNIIAKLDSISDNLNMDIASVEFTGYASPEGSYANNERLANGRTQALRSFIQNRRNLPENVISVTAVPEDWDGLRHAVVLSDLPDKDALLQIIDSDKAPDVKEAAMRRHSASWAYIKKEIMPSLRRTEYRIQYEHRYEEQEARTLEEVNKAITAGDPETAARLLVDIPPSPEADYARGVVAALQQRYDEAIAWFNRAKARGVTEADDALNQLDKIKNK